MLCEYMNVSMENNPNKPGPNSMQNKQRAQLNKWELLELSVGPDPTQSAHKHVN